jgi:hypothetical protein
MMDVLQLKKLLMARSGNTSEEELTEFISRIDSALVVNNLQYEMLQAKLETVQRDKTYLTLIKEVLLNKD